MGSVVVLEAWMSLEEVPGWTLVGSITWVWLTGVVIGAIVPGCAVMCGAFILAFSVPHSIAHGVILDVYVSRVVKGLWYIHLVLSGLHTATPLLVS